MRVFVETRGDPQVALKAFTLDPKSLFLPCGRRVGLKIHDAYHRQLGVDCLAGCGFSAELGCYVKGTRR